MRNNEWITTIIDGKTEGKAGRDRPRIPFMKQIIEDIGRINKEKIRTYKELKAAVVERDEWISIEVIEPIYGSKN